MSNIECDQNTRPRARSQSHSPQRPRLSAVSMRLRTVSWMRSASRARVACQWKAKPRISTTKPVVADSVTVSAVVERQSASASLRPWMTARRPTGFFSARTVAKAASPSAQRDFPGAGGGAEGGQRLRRPEHVEDAAAEQSAARSARRRRSCRRRRRSGCAGRRPPPRPAAPAPALRTCARSRVRASRDGRSSSAAR